MQLTSYIIIHRCVDYLSCHLLIMSWCLSWNSVDEFKDIGFSQQSDLQLFVLFSLTDLQWL